MRISRGEMVAIMGPSGCGKTTLLNTLSGLDDLTSGEVLVEGAALHRMSDRERTRYRAERMGFVFQFFNLLPVLSAAENIELPLLVAGVKGGAARGARGKRWHWWGWREKTTNARRSSPADSSSASASPARW